MPFSRHEGRAFECEGVAAASEKGGYVSEEFFAVAGGVWRISRKHCLSRVGALARGRVVGWGFLRPNEPQKS